MTVHAKKLQRKPLPIGRVFVAQTPAIPSQELQTSKEQSLAACTRPHAIKASKPATMPKHAGSNPH